MDFPMCVDITLTPYPTEETFCPLQPSLESIYTLSFRKKKKRLYVNLDIQKCNKGFVVFIKGFVMVQH